MPNLNSEIELDYKKFLRWWKRELIFLVPDRIKQLVVSQHGTLIVRPNGNQFDVAFWHEGREESVGQFERDEAGIAKYKEIATSDERFIKADLIFRLTRSHAIQKELSLPSAATARCVASRAASGRPRTT